MFENIEKEFGIPVSELNDELISRANVLERLYNDNVYDYVKVAEAVRGYIKTKNALEEKEDTTDETI